MEKDIKILEALKNKKLYFTSNMFQTGWVELDDNEKQAIENLIARNKELESALNNSVSKDEIKAKIIELEKDELLGKIDYYEANYSKKALQELLNKGE